MPKFDIAHIKEQGVDVIVVFVDSSFGAQGHRAQEATIAEMQARAKAAGLAGNVVPVWKNENGTSGFVAPENQHPFFKSTSFESLVRNKNKELSW